MARFLLLEQTHERGYARAGGVVSKVHRALRVAPPTDSIDVIGQLLADLTRSGAAIDREIELLAALMRSAGPLPSRGHLHGIPPSVRARGSHADTA